MVNILGSSASDTLTGTAGDDTLSGAGGDDLVNGLAGNDLLDAGDGNDTLYGGDGNDRLLGGLDADLLSGDAGADSIDGGDGRDTIDGGYGNDSIMGGDGDDMLTGGPGGDFMDGGAGDDIITDYDGGGTLRGGSGNDIFRVSGILQTYGPTTVDGGTGDADQAEGTNLTGITFVGVERLLVDPGALVAGGTGRMGVNVDRLGSIATLVGSGGGLARFSGGGDFSKFTLIGFSGIDSDGASVAGTAGNDILRAGYQTTISGGAGDDQIITALGTTTNDKFPRRLVGGETVSGGDGNDTITIKADFGPVSITDTAVAPRSIDGGTGLDRLVIATIATGATTLTSTVIAGIEILQPMFRVQMTAAQFSSISTLDLRPYDGSIVDPFNSSYGTYPSIPVGRLPYFEGAGSGLYDFSAKAYLNSSTIGFFGSAGSETVIGVSGNDVLAGNDGNDALYGNAGDDSLTGGNGADALFGGSGRDTLLGGDGDDFLNGGADQNSVAGGLGLDTLYLDGGRRVASISANVEFTMIDGTGRHPSLAGTASNPVQSNSFTGIERLAFADGLQVFETGDPAFVTARLFLAAFHRIPDPLGLTEVAQALRTGMSSAQVADVLAGSEEYRLRYPQADNTGIVVQLYDNALGRAPEAPVLAYFVQALDGGTLTRGGILDYIVRSDEATSRAQSMLPTGLWVPDFEAMQVARLAQATLGRHPDEAALGAWSRGVDAGFPLRDLAAAFLASDEYRLAHAGQDDTAFVNLLYANALGRAPDAGGFAAWTGALAAGVTRADIAATISESAEAKLWNAPWTADGIVFAG